MAQETCSICGATVELMTIEEFHARYEEASRKTVTHVRLTDDMEEWPARCTTVATTYVAIGGFGWGKGDTPEAAVRKCKPNVVRSYLKPGLHTFPVYRITGQFVGVNGMGSIMYYGTMEKDSTFTVRVPKR